MARVFFVRHKQAALNLVGLKFPTLNRAKMVYIDQPGDLTKLSGLDLDKHNDPIFIRETMRDNLELRAMLVRYGT